MTTEQLITKAEKWLRNETGNNCSNLSLKQAAKAMVYFHQHLLQQTQCTTPFVCGHPPNQTYLTTQCKWDSIIDLNKLWEQYERIIKTNGAIVLTAQQPFTSMLVMSNLKLFKYDWVWKKPKGTGHLNAKKQPMRDKEDVLVFYKNQCTYNPQWTWGEPYSNLKSGKTAKPSTAEVLWVAKLTQNPCYMKVGFHALHFHRST